MTGAVEAAEPFSCPDLEEILAADAAAREYVRRSIG